jgi:ubiquinone/menaquinone biosynthesis C-methylase UbiE
MEFKDYFSTQAKEYSKYRPKYPPELFEYLSGLCNEHKLAWDCATGNGQAAVGLTPWFDKVIATDASPSQIEHAESNPKVTYKVATAENSGLETGSVDLITVATAIHWVDTDKFYPEAKRILKSGGVISIWLYGENKITPEVTKVFVHFFQDTIASYWPAEIKKALNFEEIDFPFTAVGSPNFKIRLMWSLKEYLSYLYTWSSVQNYIKANGKNPIEIVFNDFKRAWGDEDTKREIIWELKMKIGRV